MLIEYFIIHHIIRFITDLYVRVADLLYYVFIGQVSVLILVFSKGRHQFVLNADTELIELTPIVEILVPVFEEVEFQLLDLGDYGISGLLVFALILEEVILHLIIIDLQILDVILLDFHLFSLDKCIILLSYLFQLLDVVCALLQQTLLFELIQLIFELEAFILLLALLLEVALHLLLDSLAVQQHICLRCRGQVVYRRSLHDGPCKPQSLAKPTEF